MKKLKLRERPEAKIQKAIVEMLRIRGWFVRIMHASENLTGFPDLYATHSKYGPRWVEVKLPNMKGSSFTPAQLENFPKFLANGTKIWVLTGATELEYNKLFAPENTSAIMAHYHLKRM